MNFNDNDRSIYTDQRTNINGRAQEMYAMKGHKINLSDNILILRLLKGAIVAISDQSCLCQGWKYLPF